MATAPVFFSNAISLGAGIVPGTADTSLTAPTNFTSIVSAGSNGTKVEQIRIVQIATTSAAGLVNLFLYDGTTHHLFDQYSFATATLTTSNAVTPVDRYYQNLMLKNGWSIRASVSVSGGASAFKVFAIGGDA